MATKFQEQQTDSNVVSSHGYTVDNSVDEYNLPKGAPPADDAAAASVDQAAADAAGKQAAEAKPGEVKPGEAGEVKPGEAKPGEQQAATASEPSGLDAVLQEIMGIKQALSNPQQPGQQQPVGPDPLTEINTALAALEEQARNGEISQEELTMKTIPLIEQRVQINMERKLQADAEAKNVRDAQGAFIAQNPDFLSFAQSPEAAAMINGNPILDNVSAYYAAKHMKSEAEKQALAAELESLKAQMANTIKVAGKEQASIVGSDAGTDAQVTKTYRGDGLDPLSGGLAALRRARAN
jgi:hypothetical protein